MPLGQLVALQRAVDQLDLETGLGEGVGRCRVDVFEERAHHGVVLVIDGKGIPAGSAGPQRPQGGLARLAGEPVEEEYAVEVVDLVLQAAGHELGRPPRDRLAVSGRTPTTAYLARTVGAQRPGTDRQPSSPSWTLLGQLDDHRVEQCPTSSSMFQENARRPTPIWFAARPARPRWSTVSSRSSTRPRTGRRTS